MRRAEAVLVAFLVVVGLLVSGGATADDRCVIGPEEIQAYFDSSAWKVTQTGVGEWNGDVYVLPYVFAGPYDRDLGGAPNVAPRQWVTQTFLDDNPDVYDFVVVLTNFAWEAGEARGLY